MKSVCFVYSDVPRVAEDLGMIDAVLSNDEFILTVHGQRDLNQYFDSGVCEAMESRIYRYIDFWGSGYWSAAELAGEGVPCWAPGPGDLNPAAPQIRSPRGAYPYRIDRHHPIRFAYWVREICRAFPQQRGVFCDDWTGQVNWWNLTESDRRIVWPEWEQGNWMQDPLQIAEGFSRALAALSHEQKIIVNGHGRTCGPRLFESFGKWTTPGQVRETGRAGDVILVKGVGPNREGWGRTTRAEGSYPVGTSFLDVFKDAIELAEKMDLRLALNCQVRPEGGAGAIHNFTDPASWKIL